MAINASVRNNAKERMDVVSVFVLDVMGLLASVKKTSAFVTNLVV